MLPTQAPAVADCRACQSVLHAAWLAPVVPWTGKKSGSCLQGLLKCSGLAAVYSAAFSPCSAVLQTLERAASRGATPMRRMPSRTQYSAINGLRQASVTCESAIRDSCHQPTCLQAGYGCAVRGTVRPLRSQTILRSTCDGAVQGKGLDAVVAHELANSLQQRLACPPTAFTTAWACQSRFHACMSCTDGIKGFEVILRCSAGPCSPTKLIVRLAGAVAAGTQPGGRRIGSYSMAGRVGSRTQQSLQELQHMSRVASLNAAAAGRPSLWPSRHALLQQLYRVADKG